jgi:hypothetical protein
MGVRKSIINQDSGEMKQESRAVSEGGQMEAAGTTGASIRGMG